MYAEITDMFERFGYTELAGVAGPDDLMVPSATALRTIVEQVAPIEWPEWVTDAEIYACEQTVYKINYALTSVSRVMDSFIIAKYSLPLSEEIVLGSSLPIICCDLARELLYDDKVTEEIRLRGDRARQYLKGLAIGKVPLTSTSPDPVTLDTVAIVLPTKVWDLEGF